jgi:hypothetical protein
MKSLILGAAMLAAAIPALAQTGVSISVGQPGFYGRIDIGDFAPAPVVYAPRPVIIYDAPRYRAEPIYLRVPPGHRKNWKKHCKRYGACSKPVLFVRDEWYERTYVPRYRERHHAPVYQVRDRHERYDGHPGKGHGKGHGKHNGNGNNGNGRGRGD